MMINLGNFSSFFNFWVVFLRVLWGFFGGFLGVFWEFFDLGDSQLRFFWKKSIWSIFRILLTESTWEQTKMTFLCLIQLSGIKKPLTFRKIPQKTPFRYQKTPEKLLKFAKNYQNSLPPLYIFSYTFSIFMLIPYRIDQKTGHFYKNTSKNSF